MLCKSVGQSSQQMSVLQEAKVIHNRLLLYRHLPQPSFQVPENGWIEMLRHCSY